MRWTCLATLLMTVFVGACARDRASRPITRRSGSSRPAVMTARDEPRVPPGPGTPAVASAPADRQAQCRTLRQRVLAEAVSFLSPLRRGLDAETLRGAYGLDRKPAACLTLPDEAIDCQLRAAHPLAPSRRCGVDDRLRLGVPRAIRQQLGPGSGLGRLAGLAGRWVRETPSAARPERVLITGAGEMTWETAAEETTGASPLSGVLRAGDDGTVWLETRTRPVPLALLRMSGGALLLSDNPLLAPWPIPAGAPVLAPLGRDSLAVLAPDRCAVIDLAYLMRLPATCVTTRSEGDGHAVITVTYHHVDTPFTAVFHLLEGHVVPAELLTRRLTRLSGAATAP